MFPAGHFQEAQAPSVRELSSVTLEGVPPSPCKEAAEIERGVIELERTVASQKNESELVLGNLDPLTRTLPLEIISYIFTFSLSTTDFLENFPEEWNLPLTLGATWRKWRSMTWSTPRLWTTICVRIPSSGYALQLGNSLPKLVIDWSGRSRLTRLTARFFVDKPKPGENYSNVKRLASAFFDVLRYHSQRWGNLDLTLPMTRFAHEFHALSGLKNLCITPVNLDLQQFGLLF